MGCLHQILPLGAQGTSQKRRQKECKSWRGWRTPGEQGSLNQDEQSSYELTYGSSRHRTKTGLHHILCIFTVAFSLVSVFTGPLHVRTSGSLVLVPALGTIFLLLICFVQLRCGGSGFILLHFILSCLVVIF